MRRVTCPTSLNAPFGAQCFPTERLQGQVRTVRPVSMHLLVLSAFRLKLTDEPEAHGRLNAPFGAQRFPTTTIGRFR